MRPTSAGIMPTSSRRNERNGNAALDRSSRTTLCRSARERGPATDRPTYCIAHGRTVTPGGGAWRQPPRLAHRLAFRGDMRVCIGAVEGDVLGRLGRARCEPQRLIEPAVVAEHRVLGLQALVNGRGAQRPRRGELLVRKADAKAP